MLRRKPSLAPTWRRHEYLVALALPRLATGDWYAFLIGGPKQTFLLKRQEVQEYLSTMENSDVAKSTGQEGIQWDAREGAGIALPYGAIMVNN